MDNWCSTFDIIERRWNQVIEKYKNHKFLCVCQYGHSRSAALVRILHGLKMAAVCIGYETDYGDVSIPLSEWADTIFLFCPEALDIIPSEHHSKVVDFNIGPDKWSNPYNQELLKIVRDKVMVFFQGTNNGV